MMTAFDRWVQRLMDGRTANGWTDAENAEYRVYLEKKYAGVPDEVFAERMKRKESA